MPSQGGPVSRVTLPCAHRCTWSGPNGGRRYWRWLSRPPYRQRPRSSRHAGLGEPACRGVRRSGGRCWAGRAGSRDALAERIRRPRAANSVANGVTSVRSDEWVLWGGAARSSQIEHGLQRRSAQTICCNQWWSKGARVSGVDVVRLSRVADSGVCDGEVRTGFSRSRLTPAADH